MTDRSNILNAPTTDTRCSSFTVAILLAFLLVSISDSALSQNQQLTKEQKKNRYENRFGNGEDQVQTATQAVRFAENVLKRVGRSNLSNIRYYAYDRLRSLLSEYDDHPEVLQILININRREQRQKGFEYSRNQRLIELLRQKVQRVQTASEQLLLVHRIIGAHRTAAQHALKNRNWKKALTEYKRVRQISSNFDGISQSESAAHMIRTINERKKFEQKTADLIQKASKSPDDKSLNREAGLHLARLKRWGHALTFLQQAHQSNQSDPLLHLVQIAVTYHLQPQLTPEALGKYLLKIEEIRNQLQNQELTRICIEIGSEIYSEIDEQRDDLTKAQTKQINSIFESWKKSQQKIGLSPTFSLAEEGPKNLHFPRDGILLFAPANGNAQDYSGNNRHGILRKGARVNLGAGILGAFEFIGVSDRWQNAVTFNRLNGSAYARSFTVAFWFNRDRNVRQFSLEDVGNVMFSLKGGGTDRIQIGTLGEYIQVFLYTRNRDDALKVNAGIGNNSWFHLALTYNGNRRKEAHLFLNGQLAKKWSYPSSSMRVNNSNNNRLAFGNTLEKSTPFIGLMDDLYFYNRALMPAEIRELYNRPK